MKDDDTPHSDDYFISTDKKRLDVQWVLDSILGSYWGGWRSHDVIHDSIRNSLCFGVYFHETGKPDRQVGFARAVTDYATFTWVADVLIDPAHRSKGLGKFLVGQIVKHPQLSRTVVLLRTRDAHKFYERFGFTPTDAMRRIPAS